MGHPSRPARIVIARGAANTAAARRGLAISGAAGMGKSTAALLLGKRQDDRAFALVVYTVVSPATTPKMLMQAFDSWLGIPTPGRATAPTLTEQLVNVMGAPQTSLVIVDEVHKLKNEQACRRRGRRHPQTVRGSSGRHLPQRRNRPSDDRPFHGRDGPTDQSPHDPARDDPYPTGTRADRKARADLVLGAKDILPLAAHIPESLAEEPTTSGTGQAGASAHFAAFP